MSKRHRSQSEGVLNGQRQNYLNNKISDVVLDYNLKHIINAWVHNDINKWINRWETQIYSTQEFQTVYVNTPLSRRQSLILCLSWGLLGLNDLLPKIRVRKVEGNTLLLHLLCQWRKLANHYLDRVIKVSITSDKSCIACYEKGLHLCDIFPPKQ